MSPAREFSLRTSRLLELDVEQTTVVTPNRRLAAALGHEYAEAQQRLGKRAWRTPDIVPLPTYIERAYRALTLLEDHAGLPQLIDISHSQLLWEQVVRKSDASRYLLLVPAAAKQALEAWRLAHAWQLLPRLQGYPLHEDGQVFVDWAKRYQQLMREKNVLDAATLPEALANLLIAQKNERAADDASHEVQLPRHFVTAGFDIVTPQQAHFVNVLGGLGVEVSTLDLTSAQPNVSVARREFATDDDELRSCAQWAREAIEGGGMRRIGIVVPDLRDKRNQIERVFTDALRPMARAGLRGLASQAEAPLPLFNISLGRPLSDYALVADALSLIEFSQRREVPFVMFSAILCSPFIAAGGREGAARARLDALLRERCGTQITLFGLQKKLKLAAASRWQRAAAATPVFCAHLDAVASMSDPAPLDASSTGRQSLAKHALKSPGPAHWSKHYGALLKAWGFPGERALDSLNYQVLTKFHEGLRSLAALQIVQPRLRADEALQQLRRIMTDTVFQPETADESSVPIQILGVLESAGQSFEALWVSGLNESAWPLAARPNPLIPVELQRRAGVPESSAATSLALDEVITTHWRGAAPLVIFSHARTTGRDAGEEPRAVSALVSAVPLDLGHTADIAPNYAEALRAASLQDDVDGSMERIPDAALPALPPETALSGGATVIRDQAACPFRAFARHRLSATTLKRPTEGHDAAERGNLLHRVLSLLWADLRDQAALLAMPNAELAALVARCVQVAIDEAREHGQEILVGRFAEIEQARLVSLVSDWLEVERTRQPFEVIACEAAVKTSIGPLAISLRLDRLDRLADGTHALIDYKTGEARAASWLGERLDEPQLPLYASTSEHAISAFAFARLKRGKTFGFEGFSAVDQLLPEVVPIETKRGMVDAGYTSWDVLTQRWDSALLGLATQFQLGIAAVDPKHGGLTCKQCDLQPLCRVAEVTSGALADDDADVIGAPDAEGAVDE